MLLDYNKVVYNNLVANNNLVFSKRNYLIFINEKKEGYSNKIK